MPKREIDLHLQIARYIKFAYPKVIFRTDFAAGLKMTIGQAVRNKNLQSESGFPDLFIAECRNGYGGLFLELKNGLDKLYRKDGSYKQDDHILKQLDMLTRLKEKGYCSCFICSFDEAKEVIDQYLK